MPIAATGSVTAAGASDARMEVAQKSLQDQFMRLFIAQLKYQDPLSPLDNKDFMAQVAQISTVESVNALKGSFETWAEGEKRLLAASLVGKTVAASKDGLEIEGLVWGVRLKDGVRVLVGGEEFGLEEIVEVR